jgi:hypothetical protein
VYLTGATTGGYTASQSSEYDASGSYNAWKAFDSNEAPSGTLAITQTSQYNNTSGTLIYTGDKDLLGDSNYKGEWIKLELPIAIAVEKIHLQPRSTFFDQTPNNFKIVGSNDDSSWDVLYHNNPAANTIIPSDTEQVHHMTHNLTKYYKYVALVANTTGAPISGNYVTMSLANLELYGHEEGSGSLDTTLKSVYNVPATTGTQLEVYYDAKDFSGTPTSITDRSPNTITATANNITIDTTYNSFEITSSPKSNIIADNVTFVSGDEPHTYALWVRLKNSKERNLLIDYRPDGGTSTTGNAAGVLIDNYNQRIQFYHHDADVQTWYTFTTNVWYHIICSYSGGGNNTTNSKIYINGVEQSNTYILSNHSTSTLTLPTTGKLTIGDYLYSDIYGMGDGNIGNVRLYSKALNADQVKELYDYQKDYFLGSKSQVTLYKGHLGVGVTEPSGQLELAGDERIQEYPPRAMTGYETLVEGHGVFCVSASTWVVTTYEPYFAFDNNDSTAWLSAVRYDNANGSYTGSTSTGNIDGTGTLSGEWLQISLPSKIFLKRSGWIPQGTTRGPKTGVILGSNNGSVWNTIHSFSDKTYSGTIETELFSGTSSTAYQYFRIIGSTIGAGARLEAREWKLFGTPGPTTLDKGSLTLGRSLDVPRISRYDVDTETPRYEKLVVDFDTTVNSSPTDISGKENHGTFKGTNMNYSSAYKAFVFNGTDDYIQSSGVTLPTAHSMSVWFNMDSDQSGINSIMHIGTFNTGDESRIFTSGNILNATIYGSTIQYDTSLSPGNWYHVVYTFTDGTTFNTTNAKIYVNGQLIPTTQTQTAATLNLVGNTVTIGATSTGAEAFKGKISNPKLYSVILEASEVKKLYNLGRTGRSMVISDTAVGIGKVPEAQLDVRGTLRSDGLTVGGDIYATGNITGYSDRRAKSDIEKIENALEKIEQLNGYTFTMKGKRYTGLIAQEILPILPEAVSGSEETNYAVAYGNMMGLIVEAIKELKQKIG